ncbi:AAA family ATPase [Spirillospora sp. NPDC050679]
MVTLFGRGRETGAVEELAARARASAGGALVVRGEPGIGKSLLLERAAGPAAGHGMAVLRAAGVQAETRLAFAGLHQLLGPLLKDAGRLPARQREALLGAFGMAEAAGPEFFMIALAALNLLSDAAARRPLLALVDDVQWLDGPTVDVLRFAARRLAAEPVALLVAGRTGYGAAEDDWDVPSLLLDRLDARDSAALLADRAPSLAAVDRERVLAEATGNPLALVELPKALERGRAAPGSLFLPLTTRLERAFAARAAELSGAARAALLVAAADDDGIVAEVLAALRHLRPGVGDGAAGALEEAARAGLAEVEGGVVRFRHPLVRSAVYQGAAAADRSAAHTALAQALAADPDRRAWHRAAALDRTDEPVAAELAAVADRARARGAITVAVAALSADPARRGGRLLRAAELAFEQGRRDQVTRLLAAAGELAPGPAEQVRALWLRELVEDGLADGTVRIGALVAAAERAVAGGEPGFGTHLLRAAALRCWWSGADGETRGRVVAAAERLPVPPDDPELLFLLATAAPAERGAVVVERLSRPSALRAADGTAARMLGTAATCVGAYDLAGAQLALSAATLRAQGRLGVLTQTLTSQAFQAFHCGDWELAAVAADEARRLAADTGMPRWAAGAKIAGGMLVGARGDRDAGLALLAEAERTVVPMANRSNLAFLQIARGLVLLGDGRHADAYGQLRRAFDPADPYHHPFVRSWGIGELAEAAVGAGHPEQAREAVLETAEMAALTPAPLTHIGLRYARALLAGEDEAEERFGEALAADLERWPFARARLQLAYGSWLRRRRRVADSRAPLRAARDSFDALGALPWGERARHELRAAGEPSDRRSPAARDRLSSQELQIARMAAAGLTNREIGEQLYLSHRTVSTHLYRLFPKLGVTSRAQLRDVLG